MLKKIHAQVV